MTQDEFKAKYNGGDKRTAKEKNLECDCYLPDSDKLKPEIIGSICELHRALDGVVLGEC